MAATATADRRSAAQRRELDLVQRHRYGDPDAFAEVYTEYERTVYNLALRMSGDPFDAADLTQDVFLRVHRHLGKFRGRSSLKTWVFRVALNHCRSRLGRRREPDQPLEDEEGRPLNEATDPRRDPEERALAGDAARRVERALARLPLAFREAVVLRDLEEMAYEEIAEVLKVRIGTVRSRIARGRERLRTALEEDLAAERRRLEEARRTDAGRRDTASAEETP